MTVNYALNPPHYPELSRASCTMMRRDHFSIEAEGTRYLRHDRIGAD